MTEFMRDDKVLYKGEIYYFGWKAGNGFCTLFEEKGMSGMQDAYAVLLKDVELVPPEKKPNFLTEENMRDLHRRHLHGDYAALQKVIIKLVEAIAEEKGWNLDG
jgi:hypothetical protein